MKKLIVVALLGAAATAANAGGPSNPKPQGVCWAVFPGLRWLVLPVPCSTLSNDHGGGLVAH